MLVKLGGVPLSGIDNVLELLAGIDADGLDVRDEMLVLYVRLPGPEQLPVHRQPAARQSRRDRCALAQLRERTPAHRRRPRR